MRAWLAALALLLAIPAPSSDALELNSEARVRVVRGRDVVLEVRARDGDDWSALARRWTGTAESRGTLERLSSAGPLVPDRWVPVPIELLDDPWRSIVLSQLFPKDRVEGDHFVHVARSGALPTYDEGLWQVALWFTGSGENYPALQKANGLASPELAVGQRVRIPLASLHPSLRPATRSDDGTLEYGRDARGEFAVYRLRRGEALWSAVVLRYTGRTAPEDVEALAKELAQRSGIRDLTDIPVGYPVRIPLDLIEPEFLPRGHPRRARVEAERAEAEAELRVSPPAPPRPGSLDGAVVILDPGHGGRDSGTRNHGIAEHDAVYDVALRLKRRLERETGARVVLTLDDPTKAAPSKSDALERNLDASVATSPRFVPGEDGESSTGVHLRWYLANAIYRRALADGTDRDRVVFVSLHADARHPGLRGAMVYVPGARYREGRHGSSSKRLLAYREVREQPTITFTRKERLRSEAVSRRLADRIVASFREERLPVQAFQPVRERVIRGRRDWLPAVLRGNAVPSKVLIEMVNLTNPDDAALIGKAANRERLAVALADALETHLRASGKRATP
ncbi:MAG TPA: N-acetylmuramoyl-L-alanine amidase [Candidatus Polarisedimenticolaceae bacterium]